MDLRRFGLYLNLLPARVRSPLFTLASLLTATELLASIQSGVSPPRDDVGVIERGGETGGDSDPGDISKLSVTPPARGRTSKKGFSIENCWLEKWFGGEEKVSLLCEAAKARAAAIECCSWWK